MQQHSSKSFVIPNASIPFDQFLQKILLVLAPVPRSEDTQTWILPPASEISNIHPLTPTTTTQLPLFRLPATTRVPNTPHHFTNDAFRQKFKDAIHKIRKTPQSNANKNYINSPAFIRDDLPPDTLQSEKIGEQTNQEDFLIQPTPIQDYVRYYFLYSTPLKSLVSNIEGNNRLITSTKQNKC